MPHFDIAHEIGSREFERPLRRLGVPARVRSMTCGDFAFYGNGPAGVVRVGVERKTVTEMTGVESRYRYTSRQMWKMLKRYDYSFLIVEGMTKPDADGILRAGKSVKDGQLTAWFDAGWGRSRTTFEHYKKRELTLRLVCGVHVLLTADQTETAMLLHALYGWFQKPWKDHKSAFNVDTMIPIPPATILDERTMRRETFAKWPHISWERSARVSRYFRCIADACVATEEEWMRALGVKEGRTMARTLVRFLHGLEDGEEREAKGA